MTANYDVENLSDFDLAGGGAGAQRGEQRLSFKICKDWMPQVILQENSLLIMPIKFQRILEITKKALAIRQKN